METVAYNGLEEQLRGMIRGYYEERVDNTVISIGSAGDRIIRRIVPLEVRRVSYHSILKSDAEEKKSASMNEYKGYVNLAGRSRIEVKLMSRVRREDRKAADNLELWQEGLVSHNLDKEMPGDSGPYLRSVTQIFENMEKSSSYIIISGFGGDFSQPMHQSFSRILQDRGLPVLNVIIKPSRSESKRRKIAESAINEMINAGQRLVVFDNEKLLGRKSIREDLTEVIDGVNNRIARKVEIYSMKLSDATDFVKYNMIN